jgi:hypothetical protein
MAEQNLLSIFGPSPEQLQRQLQQAQQERSLFAARVSPSYSAGYGLGSLLEGVVSKVFGLEDPDLKKAKDVRQAYQSVLERSGGTVGDRGAFYDQMAYELGQMGYGDMAGTSAMAADESRYQQMTRDEQIQNLQATRAYKESLGEEVKARVEERNRMAAYNIGSGLKSLQDSPDLFTKAYSQAIPKLKEMGIDTTPLEEADNPEEQVQALDYLVSLGTSQKTRSQQQIAGQKLEVQNRALAYKQKKDELEYRLKTEQFDEKTKQFYIAEKGKYERAYIAASNVDKRLNQQLQGFEETTRRQVITDIDTTEQTKLDIRNLSTEYNLPLPEAQKAVKVYQAKVKDYLTAKDENGNFLYTLSKAQDLAKQDVASAVTQEGGILGIGKKGKLGNVKPNEKKVIKLD